MIAPVLPILVVEWPDDVEVYETVEAAALSLEPWWVEEELGAAYDSEGRLLDLSIDKYNVVISLGEETLNHAPVLKSILIRFLNAVGENVDPDYTLSSLVKLCAKL